MGFQSKRIFKFDSEGRFIKTIGKEGRGPGEFQSVYSIIVTDDSKLLAYDYMSRQATIFNSDGSIDQIISMDYPNALFKIRSKSLNKIILPHLQDDHIIHIFDLEKQEISASLVSVDEVLQSDEEYEPELLRAARGVALALSDDLLIYTPDYYNGLIHRYERSDNGWIAGEQISGYRNIDKAFTIHETTSQPHEGSHIISMHPKGAGYLGFEFHSMSLGLFKLNEGRFAHMSLIDADERDEPNLVVEIFDNQGGLLKHAILDELKIHYRSAWMDPDGHLYVTDMGDEPALSKFETVWR